jgi:hypothetical protein
MVHRRHCSARGVPFSAGISAFLDAASSRYRFLSSPVWLTPLAMKTLGVTFTTTSPTPIPIDFVRSLRPETTVSSQQTEGGSSPDVFSPCVVFNAGETTFVNTSSSHQLQQKLAPTVSLELTSPNVNVFGCPWPLHLERQIREQLLSRGGSVCGELGGDQQGPRCWVSPAQSRTIFGLPWSEAELTECVASGVAVRVTSLTRSHRLPTFLILVPPPPPSSLALSAPSFKYLDDVAADDRIGPVPGNLTVDRKRCILRDILQAPWACLPLSKYCNVYGERYALSTATALRRHWTQQMLLLEKRCRSAARARRTQSQKHGGAAVGENDVLDPSERAMQRVLQCVNSPALHALLFRWGTLDALGATGVDPLPWVAPASLELEGMAPVQLFNLALTTIPLDPKLLALHPLMRCAASAAPLPSPSLLPALSRGGALQTAVIGAAFDDLEHAMLAAGALRPSLLNAPVV